LLVNENKDESPKQGGKKKAAAKKK